MFCCRESQKLKMMNVVHIVALYADQENQEMSDGLAVHHVMIGTT